MNNQDTNQTVLNSTSQDTKQPEAVAPVTDNQQTTPVTPAVDTKPTDNTQDNSSSTPVASTAPENVKLELTADQVEIVQDLLSNYVYAYQSDREVDCKRVLVPREKVGNYPYVAEAPDPAIIDPAYDWINKKWYSKDDTQSLPVIAENVADLSRKGAEQDQVALANGQQMQMITQQLGNQAEQSKNIMTMMGQMQQTLATLAKNSQSTSQAGTQNHTS